MYRLLIEEMSKGNDYQPWRVWGDVNSPKIPQIDDIIEIDVDGDMRKYVVDKVVGLHTLRKIRFINAERKSYQKVEADTKKQVFARLIK